MLLKPSLAGEIRAVFRRIRKRFTRRHRESQAIAAFLKDVAEYQASGELSKNRSAIINAAPTNPDTASPGI